MKDSILLLKTLLLSSSQKNIYIHTKDSKKKRKIIISYVGLILLCAMMAGYSFPISVSLGGMGLTNQIPVLFATIVSSLALIFTFFQTNGHLFNFKEYDMLMSLPFKSETIVGCKFLYMYIKSLLWYFSISIPMMLGYGIYAKPSFIIYVLWLLLTFILPIIPSLFSSFFGFIVTKIASKFKKPKIVESFLMVLYFILFFALRILIENIIANKQTDVVIDGLSNISSNISNIYLPIKWFSDSIINTNLFSALLLVVVSVLLFVIVFVFVAKSYKSLNSALKSQTISKNHKIAIQKNKSIINTLVFKEFKRLLSSSVYLTNVATGIVIPVILAFISLFLGFDKAISLITRGDQFDFKSYWCFIPLFVYSLISIISTTACSPSLEGKNYWIVQSLPIKKKDLYSSKMLFNIYLTLPFMIFSVLCFSISAKLSIINTILSVLLGVSLCLFSTTWGCVCGIKFMRLDWENEAEVIKRGGAITVYLFVNIVFVMFLIGLVFSVNRFIDSSVLSIVLTCFISLLSLICYKTSISLALKTF